jgi:O-antigen/teichoic acid export membrane protein
MFKWVTRIALGAIFSQIVLFMGMIPISRLFSPLELGTSAIILSCATILSVVLGNSYATAIPLAESDEEALSLTRLSIFRNCVSGLIVWIVFVPACHVWQVFYPDSEIFLGGTLAIILSVVLAHWTTIRALRTRYGNFNVVSMSPILASFVQTISQIVLGALHLSFFGLVAGIILGRASSTFQMFKGLRLSLHKSSYVLLRDLSRKWRRFALLTTPAVLLNTATVSAVVPLVSYLFDTTTAGFYFFITLILSAPSGLLGQSIASVLFPLLAEKRRSGLPVAEIIEKIVFLLLLGSAPFFLAFSLLGPELINFLFGDKWIAAFDVTKYLVPWFALSLVSSSISSFSMVNRRFGAILGIGFIESSVRIVSLFASANLFSNINPFLVYSMCGCLFSLLWILWVCKQSEVNLNGYLKISSIILIYFLAMMLGRNTILYFASTHFVVVSLIILFCVSLLAMGLIIGSINSDKSKTLES